MPLSPRVLNQAFPFDLRLRCMMGTWSKLLWRPVTSTTAIEDRESWGEYITVALQISTLSKQRSNSDYVVSRSFAFAVSKWEEAIIGKPEASNTFLIRWKESVIDFKTSEFKNGRKVDFYTHVLVTTPQDRSPRCRIWRYGERSFPSMRSASFFLALLLPATVIEVAVAICFKFLISTSEAVKVRNAVAQTLSEHLACNDSFRRD